MSDTARRIAALSADKQALLELLQGKDTESEIFPLSYAQSRLWLIDQLEPGSAAYNIHLAIRLTGDLDTSALERSLKELIRRHESLRTTFSDEDSQPVQVIAPISNLELQIEDLRHLSLPEREMQVRQLIIEGAQRPFDLRVGPLIRASLLRSDEQEHVLQLAMHHIVSDAWSLETLFRELTVLYEAYLNGRESPLPELTMQYADYARWQRRWLTQELQLEQLSYWERQLAAAPPALELRPYDPRPRPQTSTGKRHSTLLSNELSGQLRELSRREGATLFMTMLAAFNLLLYRYTGQDDIVVGFPISNRNRTEFSGVVGFFVNTLVQRTDLSGDPSFIELLQRVREAALGALEHQDIPFELLLERLHPERHLNQSPLFQVMMSYQNQPVEALELSGLTLCRLPSETGAAKFDLNLSITKTKQGLIQSFEYNVDLFSEREIKRMAAHFSTLLEGVVANPEQYLSELPLLSDLEISEVVREWNNTKADFNSRCIHELFEQQVKESPEGIALRYEGKQLNYDQLNRRANQLAHYLISRGIRPESLVGVLVNRSLEMVVALLGILKAGGAYVPLDPANPSQRLEYMVEDSGARLVVSERQLQHLVPIEAEKVLIDWHAEEIANQSPANPGVSLTTNNLAYVIYTSGSTGKPKGVMGEHRGVINRLEWMWRKYPFEEQEVCSQKTRLSFVDSVWEVFGGLLKGVPTEIIVEETVKDSREFVEQLRETGVTRVVVVPSLLRAMLESGDGIGEKLEKLRMCVVSGEELRSEEVRRFEEELSGKRLLNLYGSTEVSADATWYEVKEGEGEEGRRIAIGKAISNLRVYVLGEGLEVAPIGVGGEIYVSGEGVGRGYVNNAEKTAERFVPDPYSEEGGVRMYRTGDLGRMREDGETEYLGRVDNQVKVRGHRIELGEIERALCGYHSVREAVVLAREDMPGDKRLVAYVTLHSKQQATQDELRNHLREILPEYMIASIFVTMDEMPLNSSGKIDRRAFPKPDQSSIAQDQLSGLPRSPVEEILAAIWASVLNVSRVGIKQNFFALGGHSLLAAQLASRVRETFQIELPVRSVFENPTVAEMARNIESVRNGEQDQSAFQILPVNRNNQLPLSFAQQRSWFLQQANPNSSAYNLGVAIHIKGDLNPQLLGQSINEIIKRHEILRTGFGVAGEEPVQIVFQPKPLALALVDLQEVGEEEREAELHRLEARQAKQPFDLEACPLMRTLLLKVAPAEHILALTLHHIVSDGWSMSILLREMGVAYGDLSRGSMPSLPHLPIQYGDYAVWQRQWAEGETLQHQLAYWKTKLSGAAPSLDLPTDYERRPTAAAKGQRYSLALPESLAESINAASRELGVSPYMILLAGMKILLSKWTGQNDMVIGTVVANRNRAETEGLIGCFMDLLPIRTTLQAEQSSRDYLQAVKQAVLEAYANQDCSFARIIEAIKPDRRSSTTPIYNVGFLLQNFAQEVRFTQSLEVKIVPLQRELGADLDLRIVAIPQRQGEGMWLVCDFKQEMFDAQTIEQLLGSYCQVLEVMSGGDAMLSAYELPQKLAEQAAAARERRQKIAVTADFTTEPLADEKLERRIFEKSLIAKTTNLLSTTRLTETIEQARKQHQRPELETAYVEPRTAVEKWLAEKWMQTFALDRIGIHDNFFDLGADSIKAAIFLNNVQRELGELVYIVALFDGPTIAEMADYLTTNYSQDIARVCPSDDPLPLDAAESNSKDERPAEPPALLTIAQIMEAIDRDRKQLRPELETPYVEPRTAVEKWLAEKWMQMFALDRIGIHDNFFDLGTDSIQAALFLNSVQQELGELVYIVALFDAPTIAGLADYLTTNYREAVERVGSSDAPSHLDAAETNNAKDEQHAEPPALLTVAQIMEAMKRDRKQQQRPELETTYVEPRTAVEKWLVKKWMQTFALDRIGVYDNFFDIGADSIQATLFLNSVQQELGEMVHMVTIFDSPTIAELADYLTTNYRKAVESACRRDPVEEPGLAEPIVNVSKLQQLRRIIDSARENEWQQAETVAQDKNSPAVFILAPPRSGTTLLRVMLAGHSRLFAPPELQLLYFSNMSRRKAVFSGRMAFWQEGVVRAVMELRGCDAEQAREIIHEYEQRGASTKEFYQQMQRWSGERLLVDKSPFYALEERVMSRAEAYFAEAKYIHLLRHPRGMMASFEKARIDQVFWYEHPYSVMELAEMVWVISHQNIREFLKRIPEGRKHEVRFEEMVQEPGKVMEGVCRFLGIEMEEGMLEVKSSRRERMTDGAEAGGRMLGDLKFHEHDGIEAEAADRWKRRGRNQQLSAECREVVEQIGYGEEAAEDETVRTTEERRTRALIAIRPVSRAEGQGLPLSFSQQRFWFLDQIDPGNPARAGHLALRMTGDLQAHALEASLNEIVRRHEVLRANFTISNGHEVQVAAPPTYMMLGTVNLSELGLDEQEQEWKRIAAEQTHRRFDLAKGSLIRWRMIKRSEQEHTLLLSIHHIVSDGWSSGVLFKELKVLYETFSKGSPSPLAELPIQYADYAAWQRMWLRGEALAGQLNYWKEKLAGAPPSLNLPADRTLIPGQATTGARYSLLLTSEQIGKLSTSSKKEKVSLFIALLTGMKITLSKWTGQNDMVIGTVVANRNRAETEGLIGCFMDLLPIRTTLQAGQTSRQYLQAVKEAVLEAYGHQDCSFAKILEAVKPGRRADTTPIYNVGFLLQNFAQEARFSQSLEIMIVPMQRELGADLDLRIVAIPQRQGEGMWLVCDYKQEMFDRQTIEQLLSSYSRVLEEMSGGEDLLSGYELAPGLAEQAPAARERQRKIAVTANFTAEPLADALQYWLQQLELDAEVEFAPYSQVFQQLLDAKSQMARNQHGINVVLVRLEDWCRQDQDGPEALAGRVEQVGAELQRAVKESVSRTGIAHVVVMCAASSRARGEEAEAKLYEEVEAKICGTLRQQRGIIAVTSREVRELYPVAEYYDAVGEQQGHMPYSAAMYTAIATMIARKIYVMSSPPHKVIVLDCDNTMWGGVVGEDGAHGVSIDGGYRELQEFMLEQQRRGMLLCVCSKNNEEAVDEVFETRAEMVLKREDIVGWRVNWRAKSENLRSLSEEIGVGLDSFILVDDSPVECAEVEAKCPEVTVVELAVGEDQISQYLKQVWVFDREAATEEGERRTQMYQEGKAREQVRAEAASHEEFIRELGVEVDIRRMEKRDVGRVSELTRRTNQFNSSGERQSEVEVEKLSQRGRVCDVVEVRDRYGDYGLVGVVIYKEEERRVTAETMLLSCRALGRGVEQAMVKRMCEEAMRRGKPEVEMLYTPTGKNKLVLEFFNQVAGACEQASGSSWRFLIPVNLLIGEPGVLPAENAKLNGADLAIQ